MVVSIVLEIDEAVYKRFKRTVKQGGTSVEEALEAAIVSYIEERNNESD